MKRIYIFLSALALVILCTVLLPTSAQAAEIASGACGKNVTWVLDDAGVLRINQRLQIGPATGNQHCYLRLFSA